MGLFKLGMAKLLTQAGKSSCQNRERTGVPTRAAHVVEATGSSSFAGIVRSHRYRSGFWHEFWHRLWNAWAREKARRRFTRQTHSKPRHFDLSQWR